MNRLLIGTKNRSKWRKIKQSEALRERQIKLLNAIGIRSSIARKQVRLVIRSVLRT